MPCFDLRLSVPYLPLSRSPSTLSFPLVDYAVEHTHFQSSTMLSTCHVSFVKYTSTSLFLGSSIQKLHRIEAVQITVGVGEISTCSEAGQSKATIDSPEEAQGDGCSDYPEDLYDKDFKEMQRRKKIGLKNKGNTPWNKGLKHSAETRQRIRKRTREALRDPKVRMKLSGKGRLLSDLVKAKISASITKLWSKRLKAKRQKQNFFCSWALTIAETAKIGGSGETELEWTSYDELLEDMVVQKIQRIQKKINAKAMTRMRAEAAQAKAEEMAKKTKEREERARILAEKRREREEKAKTKIKKPRKSKEEKKKLAVAQEKKLKQKLRKIHVRKRTNGLAHDQVNVVVTHIPPPEKLDVELVKKMREKVSLADQLQAAKNKRSKYAASGTSGPVLHIDPSCKRPTNLR